MVANKPKEILRRARMANPNVTPSTWNPSKQEWQRAPLAGSVLKSRHLQNTDAEMTHDDEDEEAETQKQKPVLEEDRTLILKRWVQVPISEADSRPQPKFLADRRPGLPSLYGAGGQVITTNGSALPASVIAASFGDSGVDAVGGASSTGLELGTGAMGSSAGVETPRRRPPPPPRGKRKKKMGPGAIRKMQRLEREARERAEAEAVGAEGANVPKAGEDVEIKIDGDHHDDEHDDENDDESGSDEGSEEGEIEGTPAADSKLAPAPIIATTVEPQSGPAAPAIEQLKEAEPEQEPSDTVMADAAITATESTEADAMHKTTITNPPPPAATPAGSVPTGVPILLNTEPSDPSPLHQMTAAPITPAVESVPVPLPTTPAVPDEAAGSVTPPLSDIVVAAALPAKDKVDDSALSDPPATPVVSTDPVVGTIPGLSEVPPRSMTGNTHTTSPAKVKTFADGDIDLLGSLEDAIDQDQENDSDPITGHMPS